MSQDDDVTGAPRTPGAQKFPSVDELKDQIEALPAETGQEDYEHSFSIEAARAERAYLHLSGLADHYRHKKKWSAWLLTLIIFLMLFQSSLLVAVGINFLDFSQYQWLLPALLVQNVAQVIGLAVFVVRSLFKDMKDDT